MDIKLIFGVAILHLLALITPGPDFVLTVRNSLQFGRKMGVMTSLGFGLGIALHAACSSAGLAVLLKDFPEAYRMVRYAGAAYLVWIGLSALWASRKAGNKQDVVLSKTRPQGARECISQGFLTNVLNPKAALFILGIYSTVIPPGTPALTLAAAGAVMAALTAAWFSIVSWSFSTQRIRTAYLRVERALNIVFAVFFIAVGGALFFD